MIRTLDQLELSIKALTLHPNDILVIRTENHPTILEMQTIQQAVANLMSGLDLGAPIRYIVLPRTLSFDALDEDGMRQAGWVRAVMPLKERV